MNGEEIERLKRAERARGAIFVATRPFFYELSLVPVALVIR
jgi:hypothetical protein